MTTIVHTDPAPTLDDVWRLFRETSQQIQDVRQLLKEQAQEANRRSQEADLRSKEADLRSQEADREIREIRQLMQEQKQEAERRSQEAERALQEQRKATEKSLGRLGNRLGEFVEGFVAPAAVRLFQERNIEITGVNRDMERKNPKLGIAAQVDLLALNGDSCVVIEVKSRLSIDDINDHLERMTKFKLLFAEYQHYKVYGAVAGMVIPDDVSRYAYRKGFFVIGQTGEAVKILNDENFKPAEW